MAVCWTATSRFRRSLLHPSPVHLQMRSKHTLSHVLCSCSRVISPPDSSVHRYNAAPFLRDRGLCRDPFPSPRREHPTRPQRTENRNRAFTESRIRSVEPSWRCKRPGGSSAAGPQLYYGAGLVWCAQLVPCSLRCQCLTCVSG